MKSLSSLLQESKLIISGFNFNVYDNTSKEEIRKKLAQLTRQKIEAKANKDKLKDELRKAETEVLSITSDVEILEKHYRSLK